MKKFCALISLLVCCSFCYAEGNYASCTTYSNMTGNGTITITNQSWQPILIASVIINYTNAVANTSWVYKVSSAGTVLLAVTANAPSKDIVLTRSSFDGVYFVPGDKIVISNWVTGTYTNFVTPSLEFK